jgi:hypothetical protein
MRGIRRRADDARHVVLTLGSRLPNTPARLVRRATGPGLGAAVRDRTVLVTGASSGVLSEGLLLQTPRFGAYLASKSALDTFSRCVANEVRADGVRVTGVHMPLVRTPMIAPTAAYRRVPALRPHEGAALVLEAIAARPYAVTPREGAALALARTLAPGTLEAAISVVTGRLGGAGADPSAPPDPVAPPAPRDPVVP